MIVVQKFGGTSVDTPEKRARVCERILEARSSNYAVVAVVSAMGRRPEPYATDTLTDLAREVYPKIALRELDLLLSCGEIISSVLMVQELRARNVEAMALSGGQAGIVTDTNFGNARILKVDPSHIMRHLREGKVVIVAGFQGRAESGDITTLGRGGSDTTAAALGAALRAVRVEIYTDVPGILTADPRFVPEARPIPRISYDEALCLALEGAKVIHPDAVEIARRAKIPLVILSTESHSRSTIINGGEGLQDPWSVEKTPVTGIAIRPGFVLIRAQCEIPEHVDLAEQILSAAASLGLEFCAISAGEVRFAIPQESEAELMEELRRGGLKAESKSGLAKVALIGKPARKVSALAGAAVRVLRKAGISVLATSGSSSTLGLLIPEDALISGARVLHEEFVGVSTIEEGTP